MLKRYQGARAGECRFVWVLEGGEMRQLKPYRRYFSSDPLNEINWGMPGNGAKNLAYTILKDCLEERAEELHELLAVAVIERLEWKHWELTEQSIRDWAATIPSRRAVR
jgi:hypothetical protein